MKTVILNIPEKKGKWFESLLDQLHIRHKVLTKNNKADLIFARLIDEAMEEEGEVEKNKVIQFVKKHAE